MFDNKACTPEGDGDRSRTTGPNAGNVANTECITLAEELEMNATFVVLRIVSFCLKFYNSVFLRSKNISEKL